MKLKLLQGGGGGDEPPETYEAILFVAEKTDLFGMVFSREQLVSMIPKIKTKRGVLDAWMDGDKLVARMKTTSDAAKAGPGYRVLEPGEQMRADDEILKQGTWHPLGKAHRLGLTKTAPGHHVGRATSPIRRKVT